MKELAAMSYLAPELALDPYHPENQDFFKAKRRYEQLLVAQQSKCRERHVQVAKERFRGVSNVKIAENLNIAPGTVSQIIKRPEIVELLELMRYYEGHMNGPTIEFRKRVLVEIMIDNKEADPKVAMQASDQLNRIEGIYQQKTDPTINIQINNATYEQSPLDK